MPAIIIHSLDDAVAALKNHHQTATVPSDILYLLSPRDGAATMGAAVFQAMITDARAQFPECAFTAVLDCGNEPGYAQAAIRAGVKAITFEGTPEAFIRISNIAKQNDCQITNQSVYSNSLRNSD